MKSSDGQIRHFAANSLQRLKFLLKTSCNSVSVQCCVTEQNDRTVGSLVVRASDSRPEGVVRCLNSGGGSQRCRHLSSRREFPPANSYCPLSKNIIDADSDDENKMNNAAPVPTSSEMRKVRKSTHSCLDAHSNGEMNNKMDDID
ncbi:hypothetical protein TNCV_1219371 [Trichonephila clavipes]|nr:hypothetical protein TNCV_1219371 [Trichonephila clavipes]